MADLSGSIASPELIARLFAHRGLIAPADLSLAGGRRAQLVARSAIGAQKVGGEKGRKRREIKEKNNFLTFCVSPLVRVPAPTRVRAYVREGAQKVKRLGTSRRATSNRARGNSRAFLESLFWESEPRTESEA